MKTALVQMTTTTALFAALWLLWSGHYTPVLLSFGAASCLLAAWLAQRVGFVGVGGYALRRLGTLLPFWGWLLKEIVLSNLVVARIVLAPRLSIAPQIVSLDVSGLSRVGQAILANAITLTPGTLTVDVDSAHGRIDVHCLTPATAAALRDGAMLRRVAALD